MGIEDAIKENTGETIKLREAVEKMTAALGAGGAAKSGTTTAAAAKKDDKKGATAAAAASKYTGAQVEAKAKEVQGSISSAVAKECIKSTGAKDLNDLVQNHQAKWDAFVELCDSKLTPDDTPTEDPDEL